VSESIFLADGELLVPTAHARGPWDPRALHGGAPAALIASVFERMGPGEDLPFARLSFEFLRPIPLAPLRLVTRMSRPGKRVQALEAELSADDVLVCRASALRMVSVPGELPRSAIARLQASRPEAIDPPERGRAIDFTLDGNVESFAGSAMEMRFLEGEPLWSERPGQAPASTHAPTGAATVWMRLCRPLLPDEPPSPLARVAATADFGNGVAAALPFGEYVFINADLTISLDRRPRGEWVALRARTLLHPDGIGWAESVIHDEQGPVGRARQALVVQRR
jgi:hypothetical protein